MASSSNQLHLDTNGAIEIVKELHISLVLRRLFDGVNVGRPFLFGARRHGETVRGKGKNHR